MGIRSFKKVGNNKYHGKRFYHHNKPLMIFKMVRVPLGEFDIFGNLLTDEEYVWVKFPDGGGVEYRWESCINNFNEGIWVLI